MKSAFIFVIAVVCFLHIYNAAIVKRGLVDTAKMILAITGRNPLDFNNYGNFCGFLGEGTPVDELDKCCKEHDECYDRASKTGCSDFPGTSVYLVHYSWKVTNKTVTCNGAGIIGNNVPRLKRCAWDICECDRVMAECFSITPYNSSNKGPLIDII